MKFKDIYTKEELKELEKTDGIEKIKAVYLERQATTYLPVLVEKDSNFSMFKEGECILTINYNDLKAGTKMIIKYNTDTKYNTHAILSKIEDNKMFDKLQYEGEELEKLLNDDNYCCIAAAYETYNNDNDTISSYRLEIIVDTDTLNLYESNTECSDLECVVFENNYNAPDISIGETMYLDFTKTHWSKASYHDEFESTIALVRKII